MTDESRGVPRPGPECPHALLAAKEREGERLRRSVLTERHLSEIYYSGFDRDQMDHYLRRILACGEVQEPHENDWRCPRCSVVVSPDSVTYQVTCPALSEGGGE